MAQKTSENIDRGEDCEGVDKRTFERRAIPWCYPQVVVVSMDLLLLCCEILFLEMDVISCVEVQVGRCDHTKP